jgi:hypothetical protein
MSMKVCGGLIRPDEYCSLAVADCIIVIVVILRWINIRRHLETIVKRMTLENRRLHERRPSLSVVTLSTR